MIRKYSRVLDVFRDVGQVSYSIEMLHLFSSETTTMGPVGLSAKAVKLAEALFQEPTTRDWVAPELEPQHPVISDVTPPFSINHTSIANLEPGLLFTRPLSTNPGTRTSM